MPGRARRTSHQIGGRFQRYQRRWAVGGLVLGMAVLMSAAGSSACVFGPSVFLNPAKVKAGESVQVEGLYFRANTPVVARLNALDGPVLAELGLPQGDRQISRER